MKVIAAAAILALISFPAFSQEARPPVPPAAKPLDPAVLQAIAQRFETQYEQANIANTLAQAQLEDANAKNSQLQKELNAEKAKSADLQKQLDAAKVASMHGAPSLPTAGPKP